MLAFETLAVGFRHFPVFPVNYPTGTIRDTGIALDAFFGIDTKLEHFSFLPLLNI